MDETHSTELISAALARFPLGDCDVTPLTTHESVSAKLVERQTGRAFVLRVHTPTVGGMLGVQHTFEGLTAEMAFRQAMAGAIDLPFQTPVADRDGAFVTTVADAVGRRPLFATLLTWIDGAGLDATTADAPELVRQFGSTIATMHRFAAAWQLPQPFIRQVYDDAKCAHLASRLAHGLTAGLFSADAHATIMAASRRIEAAFRTPRTSDRWGIIHADLHGGNLVVSGGGIVPIDFSFCGYGYYLHDLAICLASLKPHLRPALVAGYREALPLTEADMAMVDACFIEGIIGGFAFHIFNDARYEWIGRRLPQVAAKECADFLAGRPVALAE